jgi:arylsulfatase A-like enzyme
MASTPAIACALTLLVPGPLAGQETQPDRADSRPDVLLVLVDDWALSDLEAARTDDDPRNDLPTIDALAARGLSFLNFYVQPVCAQTRATLMSGVLHGEPIPGTCTGARSERRATELVTVASVLQAQGYATAAFGKWHIGPNPDPSGRWQEAPRSYGFDAWRAWSASNLGGHCRSRSYTDWYRVDDGVGVQTEEYHTTAVARAARAWWLSTEGPRFAYVGFQAPHAPFHAPPGELLPRGTPTPRSRREKYEAMLVAMDTALGELLEAVDPERTLVLVAGDNGTPFNALREPVQHGTRVKNTTFEDGVNVPLIVTGPGVATGETRALGHAVDMLATLAELTSAPLPADLRSDSISLAPVLRDPDAAARDHVVCDRWGRSASGRRVRDTAVVLATEEHGLVKGRWFLDENEDVRTRRFYALADDPHERRALDEGDPVHAEALARITRVHEEYVGRSR